MTPLDILNILFQYSLLHLYMPIVNNVGYSHPITLAIITTHNTLSLTYLLFVAAVAYPTLGKRTWLMPAGVTVIWILMSLSVISTLNIPLKTAVATILPHGWLEFTAIAYWTNTIRKATQNNHLTEPTITPTIKDYIKAINQPTKLLTLTKTDIKTSLRATKLSFVALFKTLKKAYATTLILIFSAAFIETYITPSMMLLVNNL